MLELMLFSFFWFLLFFLEDDHLSGTSIGKIDVAERPSSSDSVFQEVLLQTGASSSSPLLSDTISRSRRLTLGLFTGEPIERDCDKLHNLLYRLPWMA